MEEEGTTPPKIGPSSSIISSIDAHGLAINLLCTAMAFISCKRRIMEVRPSTTTLSKLRRPVFKFLQPLLADGWSDSLQTGHEILILDRPYLIHGH